MGKYQILHATSNCPYGLCDGNGIIQRIDTETGKFSTMYCKCRAEKLYQKKLSNATIPIEFESLTINSFDANLYSLAESRATAGTARKMVVGYVKNFAKFNEMGKGLYFYSNTKGSGKTRLAVSLGNVLLKEMEQKVKFITSSGLLKSIRNTYNEGAKETEQQILESLNAADILIIDDLGTEKISYWVNEIMFGIFDYRCKFKKITIFTSNVKIEELEHDDRIKSRLMKMCIPVEMPEEDLRRQIAKEENEGLVDFLIK